MNSDHCQCTIRESDLEDTSAVAWKGKLVSEENFRFAGLLNIGEVTTPPFFFGEYFFQLFLSSRKDVRIHRIRTPRTGMRFLLSTTQRCGSTWISQLLEKASGLRGRYIDCTALGFRIGNVSEPEAVNALRNLVNRSPEVGVFKTHDIPSKDFDAACAALPGVQIVTVSREFKDVVVSRYFYYRYYWETDPALGQMRPHLTAFFGSVRDLPDGEALRRLLGHAILKNWAAEWAAFEGPFTTRNAVRLSYEGMLIGQDRQKFERIIRQPFPAIPSFEEMRKWETSARGRQGPQHFYRKGRSGQWQEWFSVEQAGEIDRVRDEAMRASTDVARKESGRTSPVGPAKNLQHLPRTIESAFFRDLQNRWKTPPTLAAPKSQLCTAAQFAEEDYQRICRTMKVKPQLHRKQWEFVYIVRCIERAGMIAKGRKGLVFGVGRESLPCVFVAGGCRIMATDLPSAESTGAWVGGNQHSTSLEGIFRSALVNRTEFFANASFRPVNMNEIPNDLRGFDFCWSSCALEHLGSLEAGLKFIRNSLKCLKPGGLAVHTTEFNLGSARETLESGPCVVYREADVVAFCDELTRAGHEIRRNLNPGNEPADFMIDRDRDADVHLRLYVAHRTLATSLGICIRKRGSGRSRKSASTT